MPKGGNGTLENKILSVIREKPNLTRFQITILRGSSERSTKRLMETMIENGTIERELKWVSLGKRLAKFLLL